MYFALLAYHVEDAIASMTAEDDAALMEKLMATHARINARNPLGPAARLGFTDSAVTLRGAGDGIVLDGPFAETKEQLLGFYLIDCNTVEEAIAAARDLKRANPSAVYEIRPVRLYVPGSDFSNQ